MPSTLPRTLAALLLTCVFAQQALAFPGFPADTESPPTTPKVEVGFSPEGTADRLILKVIGSAGRSVHVMAYEMKDSGIADALARKAARGLDVEIEVDYKENVGEDSRDYTRRHLDELTAAGAKVCAVSQFPIFHDKVMIVDGRHVETGSFNYTKQGATRNSENALVLWNMPDLAKIYEAHFQSRLPVCTPYVRG